MKPRIALPVPHSEKAEYNSRTLPAYKEAIEKSGGEAVPIDLGLSAEDVLKLANSCSGILLPGSPADINPQKFSAAKHERTAPADEKRAAVDELLLQDAFNMKKPILGVCYGTQALNVWKSGSLVQHIETGQEHRMRNKVMPSHEISLEKDSIVQAMANAPKTTVNSSHHQAIDKVGDGLRVVARSKDDVIEAVEGTSADHFVLGVQWHPERGFDSDALSRAIFRRFISEAEQYAPKKNG